jgi:hypothetical protein
MLATCVFETAWTDIGDDSSSMPWSGPIAANQAALTVHEKELSTTHYTDYTDHTENDVGRKRPPCSFRVVHLFRGYTPLQSTQRIPMVSHVISRLMRHKHTGLRRDSDRHGNHNGIAAQSSTNDATIPHPQRPAARAGKLVALVALHQPVA